MPSRTLLGALYIYRLGGIESARSKEKAVVGPNVGTGSRRYPRSFLHCGKTRIKNPLTLGYQSDHLLLTDALQFG